ncbi:autoinducer binding domain-containing protein [Ruegeria sp.]|uniref:autoinducer binding domain-containing protein n=1 Tax=Ruegeria sp. TaxID=1879320 RepID=UPI0023259C1A|nr:autoinducer binding domain-containing protein [Ruegeria sp.]MDA7963179.1 LuxR family transcriptional regulator [Ruegeria sp.]
MNLSEYLNFLSYAKTLEELWDAHCRQMAQYGFDRLLYGYTQYRTETSLGDPEDFVILTNHCQDYLDGFLRRGLYFNAPMLKWALQNEGAASWRMINEAMSSGTMTEEERQVYEFNRAKGASVGFTISFTSVSMRSKGAISMAHYGDKTQDQIDAIWDKHGEDILLMNNMAHLKILTLPYNAPNRALTKRQREALQWVGDGKTTQDIALLMGLTSATVEKHLRLAREALSVETTAQAVLKASLQNQMFVMEA